MTDKRWSNQFLIEKIQSHDLVSHTSKIYKGKKNWVDLSNRKCISLFISYNWPLAHIVAFEFSVNVILSIFGMKKKRHPYFAHSNQSMECLSKKAPLQLHVHHGDTHTRTAVYFSFGIFYWCFDTNILLIRAKHTILVSDSAVFINRTTLEGRSSFVEWISLRMENIE